MPDVPIGVKVISVLYYLGAALLLVTALLFLVGSGFVSSLAADMGVPAGIGQAAMVATGVFFAILSAVSFFAARGLWNGRNWARILAIILAAIGILAALGALRTEYTALAVVELVFDAAVGGYLLLSEDVKAAFTA